MMLTRLLRSVTMTARRQVPSMAATEDPNAPIELDFNPYEKPKSKCVLCRTETRLDYKNSRLLQQFVSTFSGRVYEQHVTGLCDSQYKHLLETIRLSRRAGYMPVMTKDAKYLRGWYSYQSIVFTFILQTQSFSTRSVQFDRTRTPSVDLQHKLYNH